MTLQYQKEFLKKIKQGKLSIKQASANLFELYANDVYRYAYSYCGNKEDAEDVVEETFVLVLEKLSGFKDQGIDIKFWLLRIARNKAFKKFENKIQPLSFELENDQIDEDESLLEALLGKEAEERLKKEISELHPEIRNIINLKIVEDYTFSEIAEICEMQLSQVKMRYYRALKELKRKML